MQLHLRAVDFPSSLFPDRLYTPDMRLKRIFMWGVALLATTLCLLHTIALPALTRWSSGSVPAESDYSSWKPSLEGACNDWTLEATQLNFSDADWRVYRAFAAKNVTSPRSAEQLSQSDIATEVGGMLFPVASRVFKLCYSYIKSFNRCHYRLLADPGPCSAEAAVTSVIAMHSLPQSLLKRVDMRIRLLQYGSPGYRLVFIVGRSESIQLDESVQKEAAAYGDIVWADFFEDYDNLTIKTIVMLRWMELNCPSARYLVKADDDVYLRMTNLDAVLAEHMNRSRIFIGSVGYNESAYRTADEKWYMPMYMFSGNVYPPFAHGPCYVLSTDLIAEVNRAALQVNYLHLEDIFLAVCASRLSRVDHIDMPFFISRNCNVSEAVALHAVVCPQ